MSGPRSLRDLQRWLADAIVRGDACADAADPVAVPPRGSVAERLRAYVDGYPARLEEALQEAFPAVAHLAGRGAFVGLTRRYARCAPRDVYNLSEIGRDLPALLARDPLGEELPFLADLARLEWAVQRAFHARLAAPFDPATVAGWSPDDWAAARVAFQPGTACVESGWPIRTLWDARATPVDEIDVALEDRPERVLVHRVGHRVACDRIDVGEAAVLRALLAGRSLGEATGRLEPEQAEALGGWTASWVRRGIVVACTRAGADASRLPG